MNKYCEYFCMKFSWTVLNEQVLWILLLEVLENCASHCESLELSSRSKRVTLSDCESNSVPEESNSVPEESHSVPEESNFVPEESNSVREESNSVPEKSNRVPEASNSVPE